MFSLMKRRRQVIAAISVIGTIGATSCAFATPLTLTGNYVQVGVSDYGTFGSDGGTEPGFLHDPTGKQNFYPGGIPNDYLTPGTPHDGFAINSDQTGFIVNDNDGVSSFGTMSPTLTTVSGYSLAATWTGTIYGTSGSALGTITNTYYFNANDERVNVATTISALAGAGGLTGLYFGRSIDPDPDVYTYGSYATNNTRGDSTTSVNDLVSGAGPDTGLTIGILNTSSLASNTSISYSCCANSDPVAVFNGTDYADYSANYPTTDYGDYGLQMAWDVGTLAEGTSTTIDYAYVVGTNQGSVTVPGVPLPASLPMFGGAMLALAGLNYGMSRRAASKGCKNTSAA